MSLPDFYTPDRCEQLYVPRHGLVAERAAAATTARADSDARRVALFGIDCQIGFCHPEGSLYVPGAVDDMSRAIEFLYRNLGRITSVILSLDTHSAYQVFHPAFWRDGDGRPPAPMTVIGADDVREGVWTPIRERAKVIEYCEKLKHDGRYALTIWPYHTLMGSVDAALTPALFEAVHYHAVARSAQPHFVQKGLHPLTENYSVMEPEVKALGGTAVGAFDEALLKLLRSHDEVVVFGEASSHCVLSTMESLLSRIGDAETEKLVLLRDCVSPVPAVTDGSGKAIPGLDFPAIAASAMERFEQRGVRVVSSTDLTLS